jgi:transposase
MATTTNTNGIPSRLSPGTHPETNSSHPDPEVTPRTTRRKYKAQYKLEVLRKLDQLDRDGGGAYLRSEGLYWSIVTQWRKERDDAYLASLKGKKRGPKPAKPDTVRLRLDNDQLKKELERARLVIDVQKKVLSMSELLATLND